MKSARATRSAASTWSRTASSASSRRGCYETPGGTLLAAAHRELEALTLDREVAHYKQHIALKYAEIVYYGQWFTPLREALDAFVQKTQENVTGTVTL